MKKLLVTLDINYNKKITDITFPYMEKYSNKIDADFKIIDTKVFNTQFLNLEKFQLYEISKGYDWTIFIDADAIIHPNFFDVTEIYKKEEVIFNSVDYYPIRFKPNNYTKRDGRNIGAATWFSCFSDWNIDLWKPHHNPEKYLSEIFLTSKESNFKYENHHIIDDYIVSLNISKYGLKVKTVSDNYSEQKKIVNTLPQFLYHNYQFLYHNYCLTDEEKIYSLSCVDRYIKTEELFDFDNKKFTYF